MSRARIVAAVALVAVVGAVCAAAIGVGGSGNGDEPSGGDLPPATATVTETDLIQTEQVQGTLSYGAAQAVTNRASGTLTWLAPEGSTVGIGQPVYEVDDQPVVLMHGSLPPFRTLHTGVEGADVAQFEMNLHALGYSGFDVDGDYTWSTATAVMQWQADLGAEQTGTVEVDAAVVASGDVRVAQHGLAAGSVLAPGGNETVLTFTGTTRVVTIALDVADQHLVQPGLEATATLPDGTEVTGTVFGVGTVASAPAAGVGGDGGGDADEGDASSEPPTVEVVVAVDDQQALGTLDAAPVDVTLVSEKREGVLAVPVAALVALAEGGYGVEVVDGQQVSYVPVETGLFADGQVEVSGGGIAEGTVVGVPE